ncbi:MAG TPA: nuclear transport factor 2 family protein [Tepidisphaeraceae bacterium]|nr:nuclear transport factor 2 family protein [Tepidisphaeraceae bacterium]
MPVRRLSTAKIVYLILVLLSAIAGAWSGYTWAADVDDAKTVADLDTRYQAAVKGNNAATMAAILDDRFVLVVGSGKSYTKKDLIAAARARDLIYIHQEELPGSQTVRLFDDTAVVTANLWIAYGSNGKQVERKLWFSDTYVRTPNGWRYAFGQASKP